MFLNFLVCDVCVCVPLSDSKLIVRPIFRQGNPIELIHKEIGKLAQTCESTFAEESPYV